MLRNIIFLFLLCALPFSALASSPLSRRDGFLLLWESIRRPAYEESSVPFEDVREDVEALQRLRDVEFGEAKIVAKRLEDMEDVPGAIFVLEI